ncbi:MAG TPA: S9 family peptidase [Microbacterium sp.]|nr:S9 family peptidase [Microbacterium sp.]
MTTILPYGTWPSPITASEVTASSPRVEGARFVADEVWWGETMPQERGRTAILRRSIADVVDQQTEADATADVVLPAPWSARSRVHEYGGGAWTADESGALSFVEQSDQRVWHLVPGERPRALTPELPGTRFGDLTWSGGRLLAVRETDRENGSPARDIVEIVSLTNDTDATESIRSLATGFDFVAYPRLSPDGRRLAFIGWNHPDMPWDATRLVVLDLATGTAGGVAGGPGESVLQPEWTGPDELTYATDRTGRWNLERRPARGGSHASSLAPSDSDTGGPLWNLGIRWFAPLEDGRTLAVRTNGRDALVTEESDGSTRGIRLPLSSQVLICDVRGSRALITGAGATAPAGLWLVDIDDPAHARPIRGGVPTRGAGWLPTARAVTFGGPAGPVHAFDYPPTNPGVRGPDGERPPYIVTVHGGPTAHVAGEASPTVAYFTSRGIGVLDVNYGGSSGYGRAYRERLAGQWGVADVADVVAAAEGLVAEGAADAARLAIKGGSAGGWTVLSALTNAKTFSAGISRYGVADLRALAAETHDFESHYLDGLVGPLPEAGDVYSARSPLTRIDQLEVPVLLLQGAEDPVVPPAQAYAVRDALVSKGIRHALVVYEGEAHGFRRAETIEHALESELSFLGQVFGFAPPGVPVLPLAP